MSYSPSPKVTIDGVDYTGQTVGRVSVSRGRRTVYESANAGFVSIEMRDVGDLLPFRVGREVVVTMDDSTGAPVRVFTGLLSDWSASTVATGGIPVVVYRVQAVGPLALLNRRVVLKDGRPVENDGERVLAAVAGASLTWEEVEFGLTFDDAEGQWQFFGGADLSLFDDGVFTLTSLDVSENGYNALQVAQQAGFSGEGVLFETGDGRIGYANADRRFENELAGPLQIAAAELSSDGLTYRSELADITNRVTLTFGAGTVVADDPFSIGELGLFEGSVDTVLLNENNATARANDFISRHSTPTVVVEELRFRLLGVSSGLLNSLLAVEVNDAVRVFGIPSRLGFQSFVGFVEGFTLTVDSFDANLSLNVSDRSLSVSALRWGQVAGSLQWALTQQRWEDATLLTEIQFVPGGGEPDVVNPFRPS